MSRSDMLGRVVTGVRANMVFVIRGTTLTAVVAFYLFLFVRWLIDLLVPSSLISAQNRYVPIVYQFWSLLCESGAPHQEVLDSEDPVL